MKPNVDDCIAEHGQVDAFGVELRHWRRLPRPGKRRLALPRQSAGSLHPLLCAAVVPGPDVVLRPGCRQDQPAVQLGAAAQEPPQGRVRLLRRHLLDRKDAHLAVVDGELRGDLRHPPSVGLAAVAVEDEAANAEAVVHAWVAPGGGGAD